MVRNLKRWLDVDGPGFLRQAGVKEGDFVLDFGCGEGHYTIPAAMVVGQDGKVYAFDKDDMALEYLSREIENRGIKNIRILKGDLAIPLNDVCIDTALCYDVIHYFKDRERLYREIYRVLKEGGLFSLYPKHNRDDFPLMELASLNLEDIIEEVQREGFVLQSKLQGNIFHDEYYNEGIVLNFRKLG